MARRETHPIHILATGVAVDDNQAMSMPQIQLFESALALPQSERADLAFQLLESLTPPGEEISREEFAAEMHARIESHQRGETPSFSLDETRAIVEKRLTDRAP